MIYLNPYYLNRRLEEIMPDFLQKFDLAAALRRCAKEGIEISNKRSDDYSLEELCAKMSWESGYEKTWGSKSVKNDGDKTYAYKVYLDAPRGIGLMYKGILNAVVAGYAFDEKTLLIKQIQGVRMEIIQNNRCIGYGSSSRGLAPLDWQKLLVEIMEEFGRETGFRNMAIQPAAKSRWKTECNITKLYQNYDEVAERLWYRRRLIFKKGYWYKKI